MEEDYYEAAYKKEFNRVNELKKFIAEHYLGWNGYAPHNTEQIIYAPTEEHAQGLRLGRSIWKFVDEEIEEQGKQWVTDSDQVDEQPVTDCDRLEEGWIKHTTGKQPVADDVVVKVKWSDGSMDKQTAGTWEWGDDADNIAMVAYRIVKEPSPEKKHYKLSEMFKCWMAFGELVEAHIYLDEGVARKRAEELTSEYRRLIAITPADADSFYEGEGLE